MIIAYKAVYRPEGMFTQEFYGSTVLKAYEAISTWHDKSEVHSNNLTPYRGYYNRLKSGETKCYSDVLQDSEGKAHVFEIEQLEII